MKEDAAISLQKGRRIPIQTQKTVNAETRRLVKDGCIEKVDEIKDNVFIQPTVINSKGRPFGKNSSRR